MLQNNDKGKYAVPLNPPPAQLRAASGRSGLFTSQVHIRYGITVSGKPGMLFVSSLSVSTSPGSVLTTQSGVIRAWHVVAVDHKVNGYACGEGGFRGRTSFGRPAHRSPRRLSRSRRNLGNRCWSHPLGRTLIRAERPQTAAKLSCPELPGMSRKRNIPSQSHQSPPRAAVQCILI